MKPEPRLSVILARSKPRALILRRGPTEWYHLISWDTSNDTFEHGAWFRGRIHEDQCDLSHDGELFLYFAFKGYWRDSAYKGSWTAVSRAPWLYALTLWPGGGSYGGGGCFDDDRKLILQGVRGTHPDHPLRGLEVVEGDCRRVLSTPDIPEADWSGYDHGGYPIFTYKGRLFRRLPHGDCELANFVDMEPNPQAAPAWAKAPLPPLEINLSGKERHQLQSRANRKRR
ncbi:MAG: hypothetical protein PHF20_03645 [Halothiobacillaceae bacterium]|nr:hypothetical protein [Halothiobacillaceae bacterium]